MCYIIRSKLNSVNFLHTFYLPYMYSYYMYGSSSNRKESIYFQSILEAGMPKSILMQQGFLDPET